jgi:hypothetical protein
MANGGGLVFDGQGEPRWGKPLQLLTWSMFLFGTVPAAVFGVLATIAVSASRVLSSRATPPQLGGIYGCAIWATVPAVGLVILLLVGLTKGERSVTAIVFLVVASLVAAALWVVTTASWY